MPRMGRPKLEESREKGIFIRLTAKEDAEVREYAATHNLTITQTLVGSFLTVKRQEQASGN